MTAYILPATGSETTLAIVAETVPGVTPATPTTLLLPAVKIDLELTKATFPDTSIQGDRMEHFLASGISKVSGSFTGNLSHSNFAPLLQTAMFGLFATKVLKTGKVLNTVTFEEWHNDISLGFVYNGCFCDKLALKFPLTGFVTLDGTIAGQNMTTETTQLATPTPAVVETPYTMVTATLKEGGTTIALLTTVDITVDNGATAIEVLGGAYPVGYTPGMSKITGTISGVITNATLMNKFLNQTASSIEVQVTDGTNTLDFNMPNVFYTGMKKSVSGQGAVAFSMPFNALKDSTSGSNLIITES